MATIASRAAASPYARVVVVTEQGEGGDFFDPVAAVDSITDASPTRPYLVKILPGTYRLNQTLVGKPHVDIEGSGQGVTILEGSGIEVLDLAGNEEVRSLTVRDAGSANVMWTGLVHASGPGAMRYVTIEGNARRWHTRALYVTAGATFDHVTATVELPSYTWMAFGAMVAGGSPTFDHCSFTALAEGGGNGFGIAIQIGPSYSVPTVTLTDSVFFGNYTAVAVEDGWEPGSRYIRNSILKSRWEHYAIRGGQSTVVYVSGSIVDTEYGSGLVTGNVKCAATYTPKLAPVTCL